MKRLIYSLGILVLFSGLVLGCIVDDDFWDSIIPETEEDPTQSQINGYVFKPALVEASEERIAQLKVPEGFTIQKFAEDLGKPRIIVANDEGQVYVSDREAGVVMLLEDTDGDGVSDRKETVATIDQAHGLTIFDNKLYIVSVREIYSANINTDGTLADISMLTDTLPDGGQHPNRTIAFGPDGLMYVSVGSTCNACPESNPMHATMLQANADGSNIRIYAKGLRNTIGFGWHPESGALWGMDHGIDWLGDEEQTEELNQINEGGDYGWPYIYDNGKYNPTDRPPGDVTYQEYSAKTEFPNLQYTAHAAPMEMVFYNGTQFPEEYQGDAFVAFRGSWNRSTAVGYKVARLRFENGQPTRFEDFLTGFLVNNNRSHFGRLVGLTVPPDGSLLVSDDTNGMIYRISY
jgi:glucose/arabinose dehydrogenase